MKSKKVFSIILSISLMFSGMSFCLAEENNEKILLIPEDNVTTAFGEFKSLKEKIGKHEAECGWSDVRKTPTNCNLGNFSVTTYDYSSNKTDQFYKLNATWNCGEKDNCSILGYDTKDQTGVFKINENGYLIANDKLASEGLVKSISNLMGMLSTTLEEAFKGNEKLCRDYYAYCGVDADRYRELYKNAYDAYSTCKDGIFANGEGLKIIKEIKDMLKNVETQKSWNFWSLALPVGILGGLAWLGNLFYKNYKLIFGKNNKSAQAQQNAQTQQPMYYYDPNSGNYYIIDGQGNVQQFCLDEKGSFQPVYQGSAPEMMPQEKKEPQKEEKPSNPEVTEKKEDTTSVTKEEPSKAKLDGILKDIMKDTAV